MKKSAASNRTTFKQLHVPPWLILLEFAFSALLLYLLSNAPGLSFPATSGEIAQQRPSAIVAENATTPLHSAPTSVVGRFETKLD